MDAIEPIDFEKGLIAPIDFHWKQGLKDNLHPSIEYPNGLLGIFYPSIEIPNDTPAGKSNCDLKLFYCSCHCVVRKWSQPAHYIKNHLLTILDYFCHINDIYWCLHTNNVWIHETNWEEEWPILNLKGQWCQHMHQGMHALTKVLVKKGPQSKIGL